MNFLLIGTLPEPKGGISVHMQRLRGLMQSVGWTVRVVHEGRRPRSDAVNLRRGAVVRYFKALIWADCVHVHTSNVWLRLGHALLARTLRRRLAVTFHSGRETGVELIAARLAARLADTPIYVSKAVAHHIGVEGLVQPAFLPPDEGEWGVPCAVDVWIADQKAEGRLVITSNAPFLAQHASQDLYGLDTLIALFADSVIADRFSCLFVVSSIEGREDYLVNCQHQIAAGGLADRFNIISGTYSFPGICKVSDVFVRATNTDGDAVSVREALAMGRRVIASDCAERPANVELFRTRDVEDLKRVLLELPVAPVPYTDTSPEALVALYRRALGGQD
jgi:hypothetical protein